MIFYAVQLFGNVRRSLTFKSRESNNFMRQDGSAVFTSCDFTFHTTKVTHCYYYYNFYLGGRLVLQ